MSGLDLRERETLLKGGKKGPAIVPGKAKDSLLYQSVTHQGELKMPPGPQPISKEEQELLRNWIDAGAVWPAVNMPLEQVAVAILNKNCLECHGSDQVAGLDSTL